MCCDAPSPPDMSAMADAQMEVAQLARETALDQLAFAKDKWSQQQEMLDQVLSVQMPMMEDQYLNAQKDRERYESVFQPLQDKMITDAESYNTQERRTKEATEAMADVTTAFEAQRENAQRNLEAYGIDPSQTRSQAIDADVRIAEAAAQAGAGNMARRRVEQTGRVLRGDAINMGMGMASQAAMGYGGALSAGNAAVGNTNSTIASGVNNMSAGYTGMNTALSGYSGAANTTNMGYQNTLAQHSSGFGLADLAGMAAGGASGLAAGGFFNAAGAEGGTVTKDGIGIPMYAEGGTVDINRMPGGTALPPPALPAPQAIMPGGPKADDVPARLSEGEFVVPAEVLKWKGEEFFEKTIQKSAEDKAKADAIRMQKQGVPMQGPQPTAIPGAQ